MKNYLLTWYGITDLRAALGLESSDGPVLSALKTGQFSDVIILAYSKVGKTSDKFSPEHREQWQQWRKSSLETRLELPRSEGQQLVDHVSNTKTAHELFEDWLRAELVSRDVNCTIQVIPQKLRQLNDATAIFNAATSAVKLALSDTDEKTITTYVSPGTPVMAYTWALIARSHPQHRIGVLASSEPRLPPETVNLPKELLAPVVAGPETVKPSKYDAIIHLLGRERIPTYFATVQFKAKLHIFITTQDFQQAGHVVSRCLPDKCESKIVTILDPFEPADTRRAIEKQIGKLPPEARIGMNLTGGTKLMFAGALGACWEFGLEPFYFEIAHHNIIFIRDGVTVPFVGTKSVTEFFTVNGFDVLKPGRWNDLPWREARTYATKEIWNSRKHFASLYQKSDFRKYKIPWNAPRNPPFQWSWKQNQATLKNDGSSELVLDGNAFPMPRCDDFGQYLGGGWLEEYVFTLLRQLESDGLIHDLRIGMEVGYPSTGSHPKDAPSGEFDCVFTDGKRLWIVECKAGSVKQEHIQKLENNLKTYGGIAARGILISAFRITPTLTKRLSLTTSIQAVESDNLTAKTMRGIICI